MNSYCMNLKKSVHYNQSAVMKLKYNEKYVFNLDTDTEHVNAVCY